MPQVAIVHRNCGGIPVLLWAMTQGMDARVDCSRFAHRLYAAGLRFVARYYSDIASKTLSPSEARKLCDAGLQLVVVFQDKNNAADLFSADHGTSAATRALTLAASIGQPVGSAIYFAVDFDPSTGQLLGPVAAYFQAIHQVFTGALAQYSLGVYGSGLTCRSIRNAGFAKFTWLSGSTGFQESKIFRPQANIVQAAPSRNLFDGQLNIDDDVAQSEEFGAFMLA
jgi:hypothetical protein